MKEDTRGGKGRKRKAKNGDYGRRRKKRRRKGR